MAKRTRKCKEPKVILFVPYTVPYQRICLMTDDAGYEQVCFRMRDMYDLEREDE